MPLWLEISNGILVIAAGILTLGLAVGYVSYFIIHSRVLEETKRLEKGLDSLWNVLYNGAGSSMDALIETKMNPLTPEQNIRKTELLQSLKYNKQLTIPEAKELNKLLQIELREAHKKKDTYLIVAIGAVLLLLAFILSKE